MRNFHSIQPSALYARSFSLVCDTSVKVATIYPTVTICVMNAFMIGEVSTICLTNSFEFLGSNGNSHGCKFYVSHWIKIEVCCYYNGWTQYGIETDELESVSGNFAKFIGFAEL